MYFFGIIGLGTPGREERLENRSLPSPAPVPAPRQDRGKILIFRLLFVYKEAYSFLHEKGGDKFI